MMATSTFSLTKILKANTVRNWKRGGIGKSSEMLACYLDRLHGQRESIEVHEKKKIEILPVYFVKVKKLASIHQVSFHAFSSHSTFQYTGTLPSPHRLSSTDTEDALFSNKNTYPSRRYLSLISIKCGEVKSPVLKPHSRKITSENAHVEP